MAGSVRAMPVLAAIDCGTNSTRLLISDGGRAIERRMVITRLGQGVDATGRLDPEAIERTIDVLREYQGLIDEHGVERTRIVATSAARDASNAEDFFAAAEAVVGARPELLSGVEEGELSFAGATAELDPGDGPFLVVDIGGGSTECMVGTDHVEEVRSFDLGCVRLTEKHLEHDPPAPEELSNAIAEATSWFDDLVREVPAVRRGADGRRAGRHDLHRGRGRDRAGRVRPRRHPPLPAHAAKRSRTCSARWPPSRSPTASTTPGWSPRGPT